MPYTYGVSRPFRSLPLRLILLLPLMASLACDMDSNEPPPPVDPGIIVPCATKGGHCGGSGDCCGTLTCDSNKVCSDGGCYIKGTHCSASSQCCGTLTCMGGVCSDGSCFAKGTHCSSSSQCCSALFCGPSGVCDDGSCQEAGGHCAAASDCCGTLSCVSGICR